MTAADAALDRVLQVFERGQHSATEMRVLLRLVDQRDAGVGELAEQLGCPPTEITRAGRRLAMRGLVRTHRAGRPEQTLMEITPSGLATVRTLLTAAQPSVDRATKHRGSTVEEMGECSFPASDPPAVWTWEVSDTAEAPTEERAGENGPIHRIKPYQATPIPPPPLASPTSSLARTAEPARRPPRRR